MVLEINHTNFIHYFPFYNSTVKKATRLSGQKSRAIYRVTMATHAQEMTVVFTEFAKGRLSPANHVSAAMEVDAKENGATLC